MSPNFSSHHRPRRQSRASNTPSFSGGSNCSSRNVKIPPVLTLPPEILSYIFELGTALLDSGKHDDSNPFPHFAVSCSHVCRHFRQVALSTPQLWTYIDFSEGFPYETAQIFLQRSKEAPLTLDVDLTTGSEWDSATQDDHRSIINDMVDQSREIYALIVPHIHRWKSFELKADYYEIIRHWLQELSKQVSAPYLEDFGIFCHEDWENAEEFRPPEFRNAISVFPGGTPRIKAVELWGVHFDWDTVPFLHGLNRLQLAWHARDVGMTTTQFMETLKQCPELFELSLQHSGPLKGGWPQSSLTLERLKILELAYLDLDIAIDIIRHVQFPMLAELSLDLEQETVEPFIDAFCSYRNRFDGINTLKLRSFQCSIPKARAFLQAMPNLTSMNLNFNYLTSSFVTVLMDRSPAVCLQLNMLKLSGLEFSKLRKLLGCRPANSIKALHLDKTDGWDESEIRWLNKTVPAIELYTPSDDEEITDEEGEEEEYEEVGSPEMYDPHYELYGDNGHMYDLI